MKRTNGRLWASCQSAKAALAFLPLIPFAISFVRCGGGGQRTTFTLPRASSSPLVVTVTALSREVGSTEGGTSVTITGSGFQPGATVLFGGVATPWVIVVSSTEIRAITPPRDSGIVDVTVRNTDSSIGTQATITGAFEFRPAPTTVYQNCTFEGSGPTNCADLSQFNPGDFGSPIPVLSSEQAYEGTNSVKFSNEGGTGGSQITYVFNSGTHTSEPSNPATTNVNGLYRRWYQYLTPDVSLALPPSSQIKWVLDRHTAWVGAAWIVSVSLGNETCPLCWSQVQDVGLDSTVRWDLASPIPTGIWMEFETWHKRFTDGSVIGAVIGTGNGTQTQFTFTLPNIPKAQQNGLVVHYTIGGVPQTATPTTGADASVLTGPFLDSTSSGVCVRVPRTIGSVSCTTPTDIILKFTSPPQASTDITLDYTFGRGQYKLWVNGKLGTDTGLLSQSGFDGTVVQQYLRNGITYTERPFHRFDTYIDDYKLADGFIDP